MTEARRRAYLEAMGYDVWVEKPPGPGPVRLVVGPGEGSDLLVCEAPDASGGKLAADIARALGTDPVWAWPDPEHDPGRPTLEEAVADRLFTHLLVFGEELARLVSAADVFVFPSRTDTLGLVMLEAMALGVPVLSTPVSGAHDVLADGVDPEAPPGRMARSLSWVFSSNSGICTPRSVSVSAAIVA